MGGKVYTIADDAAILVFGPGERYMSTDAQHGRDLEVFDKMRSQDPARMEYVDKTVNTVSVSKASGTHAFVSSSHASSACNVKLGLLMRNCKASTSSISALARAHSVKA